MPTKQLASSATTTIDNTLVASPTGAVLSVVTSGGKFDSVLSYSCDFGIPIPYANKNGEIKF